MNTRGTRHRTRALIAGCGVLGLAWHECPAGDVPAVKVPAVNVPALDASDDEPRILLDEPRAAEFDAGLWRSEFNPTGDSPSPAGDYSAPRKNEHSGPAGRRVPPGSADQGSAAAPDGRDAAAAASAPAGGVHEEAIPVIISPSVLSGSSPNPAAKPGEARNGLSEWESCLATAAFGASGIPTSQGPSITTYLVAIAAAIVGIGAMLTPK